eukprot:9415028-Pyramimonas_sp.AAC.2
MANYRKLNPNRPLSTTRCPCRALVSNCNPPNAIRMRREGDLPDRDGPGHKALASQVATGRTGLQAGLQGGPII